MRGKKNKKKSEMKLSNRTHFRKMSAFNINHKDITGILKVYKFITLHFLWNITYLMNNKHEKFFINFFKPELK